MLKIIKVSGQSMSPDFNDGDYVLVSRIPLILGMVKINSILVFNTDKYGILIKKVSDIDRINRKIFFTGINSNSLSGEMIGAVPEKNILGSVILHFKKPVAKIE